MTNNNKTPLTVDQMLTAPLDEMPPEDRTRLMCALLKHYEIQQLLLSDVQPDSVALVFAEDRVLPNGITDIRARSYCEAFQPTRLLVLETEYEQRDRTETCTKSGLWFWKHNSTTTQWTERTIRISPSAWNLHSCFAGNQSVLGPGENSLSMAVFSLRVLPDFKVQGGIDVILRVSHNLLNPAPFRALLLGKTAKRKPLSMEDLKAIANGERG